VGSAFFLVDIGSLDFDVHGRIFGFVSPFRLLDFVVQICTPDFVSGILGVLPHSFSINNFRARNHSFFYDSYCLSSALQLQPLPPC